MGISSAIATSALQNGIDPNIALRVFKSEGAGGYVGDGGSSFGPFQFHYGGINQSMPNPGIGDLFTKATGLDARDPATLRQQIDFAMRYVSQNGWGPWMGAAKQGITGFTGVGRPPSGNASQDDLAHAPVGHMAGANLPAANAMTVANNSALADPLAGYEIANQPSSSAAPAAKEEFAIPPKPAAAAAPISDPLAGYEISTAPETTSHVGPPHQPQPEAPPQPARPAGSPPIPPPSAANAGMSGFFNGLPIVGPYALSGMQRLTAFGQSQATGQPYAQALSDIQNYGKASTAAYPKTALAGGVGGAVAGTVPAMAAAPGAFGLGAGSLLARAIPSALTGAGISGADALARGGSVQDTGRAAALGGVFGAAAPAVGALAGGALRGTTNALSDVNPGSRYLASKLAELGMTPADAQASMARMGPNAVLADTDPELANVAGGLAALGGKPNSIISRSMIGRAAGKDDRVGDAASQFIGPRPDLTAAQEAIKTDASTASAPYYNAFRATAQPMNTQPVLSYIDAQLARSTGAVADVLKTAKGYLTQSVQGPTGQMLVPKDDPQTLLGARQALDDLIERRGTADTSAGSNAIRQAQAVRGQLDQVLKTDPNVAAGDAIYSAKMAENNALQEGTDLFKSGTRIEDLQRSIAGKTPDQLDAMRTGALSALHDRLDGVSGDFSAARMLFAKATANRAKLDALFPGDAQQLFDRVEGEMAMRATETTAAHGSQTAARTAFREQFSPPQGGAGADIAPTILGEALYGGGGALAGKLGSTLYRNTLGSVAAASRARMATQAAQGSMAGAGSPLMDQISRAYGTNALARSLGYGGNMIGNALTRNSGPLVPPSVLPSRNFPALPFAQPALIQQ